MRIRGFTLLELLLVILITGILAVVVAPIIRQPIVAYFDQTTRAELVDSAEMALRRMARDARRSLPYSLRPSGPAAAFEFINVLDVARYRENGGPADDRLRFNNTDDHFNVLGTFPTITAPMTLGANQRLAIFNLTPGTAGFDAYNNDAVVTPSTTAITITADGNEHDVEMNPAHQFQASSPSHRVYITNGATSYACFNGGLWRHANYAWGAAQPGAATVAANGDLMTDNVDTSSCAFSYDPGNSTRPGLLMLKLTLTSGGESITLLHQVHIHNAT